MQFDSRACIATRHGCAHAADLASCILSPYFAHRSRPVTHLTLKGRLLCPLTSLHYSFCYGYVSL